MQASRLLSILLKLQTHGRLSAKALAESFEVSVRTIYRDIDALSAAGVPIYADKGRHGGFALRDGYHTRLTGLDRPEAQSLFLSGVPFAATQLGLGAALDSTRLKLLAALPAAARQEAEQVASRFHLDPIAWYQGPDEQGLLPELAAAVWLQRSIEMRYDSWKGLVEREVAPLGLVLKGGLWYFVAATEGQARTYRVASIEKLTVRDTPAPPPPAGFELKRYWASFARDFEARMQAGSAVVRARLAGLRELARQSHANARAVAAAQAPDAEGWQRLRIPIESVEAAVGELLRLGADVEALEPPELRAALQRAVLNLNRLYGK